MAKKIPKKEGESYFFVFLVATMREIKAPPRPISSIPIVPKKKRKRSCHSHFHCLAHPLSLFFSSSPGKKREKCDSGAFFPRKCWVNRLRERFHGKMPASVGESTVSKMVYWLKALFR